LHAPGTLIEGKYEILGKIREGGMGAIYKVRHRLLDEVRVIKVMRPAVLKNEELKKRFVEEAKTATRLKHPNICTIHDFALDEDGTAYLVMEFIDGVTLAELGRTPTPVPVTLEIAAQALQALGYLHRRNVVHRDIAPDNLMLTTDEEGRPLVKLIDLGIAKALDRPSDMTSTGVFLGKLKYASPEQYGSLAPGEKIDGRSDLYCLGVVIYELLTGQRPLSGETPAEMLRAHLFQPPTPFEQSDPQNRVPPDLRAVILKVLEKKREDRYADAEDFGRDIERVRAHYGAADEEQNTIAFVSNARATRDVGAIGITPSAQDRLDRRFGQQKTPSPSSSTTGPKRPSSEMTDPGLAKTTTLTPKIRPAEEILPPLEPLPEHQTPPMTASIVPRPPAAATAPRRSHAWLLALGVLAAAVLVAVFVLRGQRAQPAPAEPSARLAATAAPAAGGVESPTPEPATVPTEVPVPTLAPPIVVPPTRAPAPTQRPRPTPEPRRTAENFVHFQVPVTAAVPTAAPPPTAVPTAAPRPTSVPAIEVTPERPVPSVTDADRVREAIRRWERAQNTLDADAYARVFPRVDKARIQAAFDGFRTQTVSYVQIRVEMNGPSRATAHLFERRIAVPRVGAEQRAEGNRTVTLQKSGDSWVIVEVQ
jgi:eukaryotic-like serine/threonine-protein kinase